MSLDVLAVYPGTFDPITLGHEDVIRRACQLFDRVIVGVAAAHHKRTLFSLPERIEMVREAAQCYPQVTVEPFDGLVRDFVVGRGGVITHSCKIGLKTGMQVYICQRLQIELNIQCIFGYMLGKYPRQLTVQVF